MKFQHLCAHLVGLTAILITAQAFSAEITFERQRIGTGTYEAGAIFDVNNDGVLDIVSGEYWHPGPDFAKAHKIATIMEKSTYYDDFSNYPLDVNGDGYLDIMSGGWFGETLVWRENPKGQPVEWTTHEIAKVGNVERGCFWDIDGDGFVEAVPNLPNNGVAIFILERDAAGKGTGKFRRVDVYSEKQGHGLGFGDVNGDGHGDLVMTGGWLEAPEKPFEETWTFHAELDLGHASIPIFIRDLNNDGKNDLIVGQGHDYGLSWIEQGMADGKRTWTKHEIEPKRSQFHEMALADLDNDGTPELITGKRYQAHNGGDPGAAEPVGLYYYPLTGTDLKRHVIDYGPAEKASGTGIYLWVEDING
ncbi:MAG: VCBS repeat-containing protein, partial [Candidatus Hydrogenedentes bacterium]|nr:VCBS repeat-containing protein [Candidatus Hydrogenedentota bacterium]